MVTIAAGCSVKKNNIVSRSYHGVLAHYNGYWNAENKYDEGVAQLAKAHEDKYDRVLSIYQYGDANKAKAIYPLMDDAIKRVSLVIQRQTMYIKDKTGKAYHEHNKWIPKNWLLVGKCRFMKREYFNALETFQFMGGRYAKGEIRYDAFLMMLKVYNEMSYVSESDNMIDFLKNDPGFPKRLKGDFYASCANYDLMTKENDKAIADLTKSISFTKKRYTRARYTFILGQLYQKQGDNKKASEMYDKVCRMNAPYELNFNAEIASAMVADANSTNSDKIKKKLKKMAKDIKNSDYLDQIYYALGGIEYKEGNTQGAIDYYHKSITASLKNTNQKALSYLALGKIYFDRPEYKPAQMYYDSTITFLTKDHPDYPIILNKRNTLTKLIKNLNIIAYEDSLQRVAGLSEGERNKMIDGIIEKDKEEKAAAKQKEKEEKDKNANTILSNNNNSNKDPNKDLTGGWYFYNPSTISFGYSEFLKKWGNRKNEDDWRRSSKQTNLGAADSTELESADAEPKDTTSSKDSAKTAVAMRDKYLKNVPVTDKLLEASNGRIIEAYYTIGLIYKEQFLDYNESIKAFETLNKRFPENRFLVPTYYNLYRINLTIKNNERAEYYKNLILTKYPESEFARLIKNPNAAEEEKTSEMKLNSYYEDTYNSYLGGQYPNVIARKFASDSIFPGNALKPKFDYLRTLSIGRTKDIDVFEKALTNIVQDYPKDSVSVQAKQILDYINKIKGKTNGSFDSTKNTNAIPYVFNPDSAQYYVLSFPNKSVDAITVKTKVQDYLSKYYGSNSYDVGNFLLDVNTQIIVVKEFGDSIKGMDFYNGIVTNDEVFGEFKAIKMNQFLIDATNYKTLYGNKDVSKYLAFFNTNYLKLK